MHKSPICGPVTLNILISYHILSLNESLGDMIKEFTIMYDMAFHLE